MGFLRNIFKKEVVEIPEEEIVEYPEEDCRWECRGCGLGIDPKFHKYTKQNGDYFHKMCWKKAIKITKEAGAI